MGREKIIITSLQALWKWTLLFNINEPFVHGKLRRHNLLHKMYYFSFLLCYWNVEKYTFFLSFNQCVAHVLNWPLVKLITTFHFSFYFCFYNIFKLVGNSLHIIRHFFFYSKTVALRLIILLCFVNLHDSSSRIIFSKKWN